MNCEDLKRNFVEYWRDTLNPAELQDFEEHLASCEQCRTEAEGLKHVWSTLGEMPEADPGIGMRTRFYASLRETERREMERHQRFWWMRHPAFQAAFALAILVAGIFIGNVTARGAGQVAQLRNEVNSMKQLVTLSLLQQQNASDRLRGVNWSYRVEQSDSEVLSALLTTVNHDPNVNVRLAAVDALRNFSDSPVGRRGLVQALNKQASPMVEIAILDQLVEMRERSAKPAINVLMTSGDVNPEVKQHANWALRQLQ
jgi:putative zinc finger protein